MIIDFPNQLTNEEEQLLKKIAKMKKKRKTYQEKKAAKDAQTEAQNSAAAAAASSSAASSSLKRANSTVTATAAGKQLDAKEAAKKLIQSGVIKLETESKEKGFKRSCSRKDEIKKVVTEEGSGDKPVSYSSSANSPMASPLSINSPSQNKFFFNDPNSGNRPNYQQRNFQFSQTNRGFRNNSFNSGQTPNSSDSNQSSFRYPRNNNNSNMNKPPNQQGTTGVSLYIKANNITEELLRSLFTANVSSAKINSIEVKTNFAFVNVDTKESAETAIQELNGKVFNESMFSVSFARPRKPFNRNTSYERTEYDRQMSSNSYEQQASPMTASYSSNTNPNSASPSVSMASSPVKSANSSMDQSRQVINYEDI